MKKMNHLLSKLHYLKSAAAVVLAVIIAFSGLCISTFAADASADLFTAEPDTENIIFNAAYPEVGKEMKVSVAERENETFLYRWYVNNEQINNFTDTYTPVEGDLGKMITVKVYDTDAELTGTASMFMSQLPVVYIEVDNRAVPTKKGEVFNAQLSIQGNSKFNDPDILYDGKTEIKVRGNMTASASKKPYKLKLDKKTNLLGMGKNKHWVLLSNPYDRSNLKNDIASKIAAGMGLYSTKSEFVDVVLNGKCVGLYQLCEHVRVGENRVNITDWDTIAEDAASAVYKANKDIILKDNKDAFTDYMAGNLDWVTSDEVTFNGQTFKVSDYYSDIPDITGGYLLKVDNGEKHLYKAPDGKYFALEAPEYNEEEKRYPNKDMENYITGYYSSFISAVIDDDFSVEYDGRTMRSTDFIDVDSFAKGILVNELMQNEDFGHRSTYMYKDVGGKLTFGPVWDMDLSNSNNNQAWVTTYFPWIKAMCSDPVMMNAIRNTYWEYRYTLIQDLLEDDGLLESTYAEIKNSTGFNNKLWETDFTGEEYKDEFKFKLKLKIAWMDKTFATLESAVSSVSSSAKIKSASVNLAFNDGILDINCDDNSAYAKIYADGVLVDTVYDTASASAAVDADEDSVITVVTYDADNNVLNGNFIKPCSYVNSLTVTAEPDKKVYNVGDEIDLTGLVLTANYADGTSAQVTPDLAYTYTKDALGPQFNRTDKITDVRGNVYIVLRYANRSVEFPVTVNAESDYMKVQEYINRIPSNADDADYLKRVCEAWVEYNALSAQAKASVSNADILNNAINGFGSCSTEVIGVYAADGVLRNNASDRVVVVVKGSPSKIVFHYQDSQTTTASYSSSSAACLSVKKIGNYSAWTINFGFRTKYTTYSVRTKNYNARYIFDPSALLAPQKADLEISCPDDVYKNADCEIDFKIKGSDVSEVKLTEGDTVLAQTDKFNNGIVLNFNEAGTHNIAVSYMSDNKWFEYGSVSICVRDEIEKNMIFYEENVDGSVKVITDESFNEIPYASETEKVKLSSRTVNNYKVWTGSVNTDETYQIFNEKVTLDAEHNFISGFEAGFNSFDEYLKEEYVNNYSCTYYGTNGTLSVYKDDAAIGIFTVIIYGDVNGDGWYDGSDSVIVNCLANGILSREQVGEAVYAAADSNHDYAIDENDVALLEQAGLLLANVDQSKTPAELFEDAVFSEYINLITQSPVTAEKTVETAPTDTTPADEPVVTQTLFQQIMDFIIHIFNLITSYISKVF